jgi:hypothetical protein
VSRLGLIEAWNAQIAEHDRKPQRDRMWQATRRDLERHLAAAVRAEKETSHA